VLYTVGARRRHFRLNGGPGVSNSIRVPTSWNVLVRAYLPKTVDSIVKYRDDLGANHKVMAH
jgi:hypothetical protein